jgi:hypothetical protein
MFVLIFSTTFVPNISHSKMNWVRYDQKCITVFPVKYTLFLFNFGETWIFSKYFRKIVTYQISWKSIQWEPSCPIWTEMTKLIIVIFQNFASTPKNVLQEKERQK